MNIEKIILAALFVAITWFQACGVKANDVSPSEKYISDFLRIYPKRKAAALKLLPTIEGYSAIHAIDPLLVSVVISHESAWKTNAHNADKNEKGLMQVHGVCAKGFDLSVPEQQIQAGIACLARARDACDGSLKQTLTMYQSGRCKARTARTARRVAGRLRVYNKWKM